MHMTCLITWPFQRPLAHDYARLPITERSSTGRKYLEGVGPAGGAGPVESGFCGEFAPCEFLHATDARSGTAKTRKYDRDQ